MSDADIRVLYERARAAASGSDFASQMKARSLNAFADQYPDVRFESPRLSLVVHMADERAPDQRVSATDASRALSNMQRSVARLAKARKQRVNEVQRLRPIDIAEARLDVREALAGSLIIQLDPPEPQSAVDPGDTLAPQGPSAAELAVMELVTTLPEDAEDSASMDAIPAARPVLRRAVADLVAGWKSSHIKLDFRVQRGPEVVATSELSSRQIQLLDDVLSQRYEDKIVERRRGRLDGLRTRRRLFYFEPAKGPEIHGTVDEDLLGSVRDHLDEVVDVELEVVLSRLRAGHTLQRSYRLVAVSRPGELKIDVEQGAVDIAEP